MKALSTQDGCGVAMGCGPGHWGGSQCWQGHGFPVLLATGPSVPGSARLQPPGPAWGARGKSTEQSWQPEPSPALVRLGSTHRPLVLVRTAQLRAQSRESEGKMGHASETGMGDAAEKQN